MVKFEEETYLDNVRGALALRGQIEAIVDAAAGQCGNLCWLGIGGTWASCLQTTVHMKERSAMEVFALNAAEYNTTGRPAGGGADLRGHLVGDGHYGGDVRGGGKAPRRRAPGCWGSSTRRTPPWPGRWTGASASPTTSS